MTVEADFAVSKIMIIAILFMSILTATVKIVTASIAATMTIEKSFTKQW